MSSTNKLVDYRSTVWSDERSATPESSLEMKHSAALACGGAASLQGTPAAIDAATGPLKPAVTEPPF